MHSSAPGFALGKHRVLQQKSVVISCVFTRHQFTLIDGGAESWASKGHFVRNGASFTLQASLPEYQEMLLASISFVAYGLGDLNGFWEKVMDAEH